MSSAPCTNVRVPAKVNLFLAVRGIRDDGYHELVTIFQSVAITDQLTLRIEGRSELLNHPAGGRRTELSLAHDAGSGVPTGPDNLIVRAAQLLADARGIRMELVHEHDPVVGVRTRLELTKRIPVAGGMAGGSADAAAALVGLNELWDLGIPRSELRDMAAELGADVPFTVMGGTALATGTGTGFARVLCRGAFHWVVCAAEEELSTPAVYKAWDDHCSPSEVEPDAVLAAVAGGDPEALGAALHNDLQPAAEVLLPRLAADRKALLDAGALGAVVSGSGPTIVGLAADAQEAQRIARRVAGRFPRVLITTSPSGGPVVQRC